jgi:hypothetical protein
MYSSLYDNEKQPKKSDFKMTHQILFLLQSAYEAFKVRNPLEKPFWKIYCVKKVSQQLSRADTDFDWRQKMIIPDQEVKEEKLKIIKKTKKIVEEKKIVTKEGTITDNNNMESPYKKVNKPKITRVTEEIIITSAEDLMTEITPHDCEITTYEPEHSIDYICTESKFLSSFVCPEITGNPQGFTIYDNMTRTDLSPVLKSIQNYQKGKFSDSVNSIVNLENLKNNILEMNKQFTEKLIRMRKELREMAELAKLETSEFSDTIVILKKALKEISEDVKVSNNNVSNHLNICDPELLKRANQQFNKERSATQIIEKYLEVQQKLNNLKSKVMPILRKHSRLHIEEILKTHTFIDAIGIAIQHYDDEYESEDSDYDVF